MSYKVKNQEMGEELRKAEQSQGYLVLISRLSNGKLFHHWRTLNFPKEDIIISLNHHIRSLEREKGASISGEMKIEKRKVLPPEYRKKIVK